MGDAKPGDNWYHHFRRRPDHRGLYIALGISAALHLSMVTVFSIVIHFPRQDIQFRDFQIVPVAVYGAGADRAEAEGTEAPGGPASGEQLALRGIGGGAVGDIQLPTLEFAELERLRVRQEGVQALSRYEDLFREPEQDSWARFSRSLSGLTRSLSDLRLSGGGEEDEEDAPLSLNHRLDVSGPAHRPAEGFEAYIIWSGEPRDRQLLFAPPVEALWNTDPADFPRPIEVVLQVNALGRVVNVFSPNVDARELVDAVQLTALKYRFEPLALDDGAMQTATLRIRRERAERAR